MTGAIAIVLMGAGVVLILSGTYMSLRRKDPEAAPANEGATGLVKALAELAKALQPYPRGLVMIFLGVLLLLAAAIVGTAGAIAA